MGQNLTIRQPFQPVQPGAYSTIDATALLAPEAAIGQPIPAIVGATQGGAPNVVNYFRDPQAMRSVLRGGAAYDVARFCFSACSGPVAVVRAGAALQSTLNLAGATGTAVVLNSQDYGAWTNGISVAVNANNQVVVTYTDPNGVLFTETFAVGAGATVAQVVAAINGQTYGIQGSALVTATAGAGTMPLAVVAATAMAGGVDPTLVAGDWTTALQKLEPEPVDIIIPAIGDPTVHAQVLTHCQNMSTPQARQERVAVVGGVLGENDTQIAARMTSLRDKRIQLVGPGFQDYTANGVLQTWDPFYLAGKIGGMHAALPDEATSLCHKRIAVVDVERRLSTIQGGSVDTLLSAGVTPITPAPNTGFWIVDSLSGWNTDDSFRDFHKIRTADVVAIRARVALEAQFVGTKTLDSTVGDITQAAANVLESLLQEGILRAYQTPVVQNVPPRTFFVSLPVMLPDAVKFIFITVALQPAATINRASPATDDSLV